MLSLKKHYFLSITLVFFALILPNCFANVAILLNGTSSTGKSSVAKELSKILDGKTEITSLDYYYTQARIKGPKKFILEYSKLEGNDIEEETEEEELNDFEYAQKIDIRNEYIDYLQPIIKIKVLSDIKKHYDNGKNVIIDMVLFCGETDNSFIEQLQKIGIKILFVLVYCPPDKLIDHVLERNTSKERDQHRYIKKAIGQFPFFYKTQENDDDYVVDILKEEAVNKTFKRAIKEDLLIEKHACQIRKWEVAKIEFMQLYIETKLKFKNHFCLDKFSEVKISPILAYDCIVNSSASSAKKCAERIQESLDSADFSALKKNKQRLSSHISNNLNKRKSF